jgi:hypothetical protein
LNRRYQRTATTITSAGNRNPANADFGGNQGRGRLDDFTAQACLDHANAQRNSAGAVAGGLLGTAAAAAVAAGFRSKRELAPYMASRLPLPAGNVLALLLLITLAVTVLGAWLPARRAARLAPSDAIKEW